MNQKFYILFLLLVTISYNVAHANTEYNQNNRTSPISIHNATTITEYPFEKRNYSVVDISEKDYSGGVNAKDLPGSFSVVQDWNLVCKQLCGAALGGPNCGPQCKGIADDASQKYNITEKAKRLLDENEDPICRDLCIYQLGGDVCSCNTKIFQINEGLSPLWERNQVCNTFCEHNDITLTGCSFCTKDKTSVTPEKIESPKVPSATTPNWAKICQDLCKSGDGGSLCNCDKPPFF